MQVQSRGKEKMYCEVIARLEEQFQVDKAVI